jgi:hypothetical protein
VGFHCEGYEEDEEGGGQEEVHGWCWATGNVTYAGATAEPNTCRSEGLELDGW